MVSGPAVTGRLAFQLWLLAAAVLALAVAAVMTGPYQTSLGDLLQAAARYFGLGTTAEDGPGTIDTILFGVRIPRVAAALLTGAALAGAGAVYQGLFRNPLVSPDILGVSAGAGLGAAFGIFFSLPVFAIQGLAFVAGLGTVGLVYLIATMVRSYEPTLVLVLSGVVMGALAGACLSLLKILADPYDQLPAITFWLLGSLAAIRPQDVWGALPAVLIGLLPILLLRWRMNVMSLGDEEASALGINPRKLRLILVMAATLMTAAVVSIAGVVGWVGLVIPHIARLLVGPDFTRLLPTAMLIGAGYMLLIDMIARNLTTTETPLGVLTAFIGAPVFIWLLASGRRGWS